MYKRFALILTPNETSLLIKKFEQSIPMPLVIGILQGGLRIRGYEVVSTDLNAIIQNLEHKAGIWQLLYKKEYVIESIANGLNCGLEEILDELLAKTWVEECDISGISIGSNMSMFEIHMALLLGSRIIRKYNKPVILGGANVDYLIQFQSVFKELWTAMLSVFKYIVVGPGEKSLCDILEGRDLRTVKGIVYSENGAVKHNSVDVPSFVCPDFSGLDLTPYTMCVRTKPEAEDINIYQFIRQPVAYSQIYSQQNRKNLSPDERKEILVLPYIFNNGCSYRCAFCVQSRTDSIKVTSNNAINVVNDLEKLLEEYETMFVGFYNNAFNLSIPFVRKFCSEVNKRGLKFFWSDCCRFNNLTEEIIDILYGAGCRKLVFGLDTASERILKLIDKQLDLDQAKRVLYWCKKRGISAEVEIIVGLPYEGESEFLETYDFVRKQLESENITTFHLNRYFVIPCSRFGSRPDDFGIKLHYEDGAYEKMLKRESEILTALDNSLISAIPYRFDPLRYSETIGRSAEQIRIEAEKKYEKMLSLKLNKC